MSESSATVVTLSGRVIRALFMTLDEANELWGERRERFLGSATSADVGGLFDALEGRAFKDEAQRTTYEFSEAWLDLLPRVIPAYFEYFHHDERDIRGRSTFTKQELLEIQEQLLREVAEARR